MLRAGYLRNGKDIENLLKKLEQGRGIKMNKENEVLKELIDCFGEQNKPQKGAMTVETAIEKAYADMSRRAKGHTPDVKKEALKELKKIFDEMPSFNDEEAFDKWHEESCEKLRNAKLPNGFIITYGRAQKVINMTFKYLMYSDTPHADAHDYCHMALDSYTLAWYKRKVDKDKKNYAWSKIDDYGEYKKIQDNIRGYLGEDASYSMDDKRQSNTETVSLPEQPILAEFIVWEGEKLRRK